MSPAVLEAFKTTPGGIQSYRDGRFLPVTPTGGVTLGFPIYSQAERDSWPGVGNTHYAALSAEVNMSKTIMDMGTTINSLAQRTEMNNLAPYAKALGVLYQADGLTSRRTKAIEVLDAFKDVTSFRIDNNDGLWASWAVTNLCQCASMIGYQDNNFENFLRNVILVNSQNPAGTLLDWAGNGNWLASMCESRGTIGSYLEDDLIWNDFMEYFAWVVPRLIYYRPVDGLEVVPLTSGYWPARKTGTINGTRTYNHWGQDYGAPQLSDPNPPFTAEYPVGVPFPDGTEPERRRDLGHGQMTLTALMHCARMIRAQNDTLTVEQYQRLKIAYDYMAQRCNTHIAGGSLSPAPINAPANDYRRGWFGALILFGSDAPASVVTMANQSLVTGYTYLGVNTATSELFADRIY